METQLRILLLEDSPNDAELIRLELDRGGVSHISKCVSTRAEFLAALSEFKPDLVLADYKLPNINGAEALSISQAEYPNLPFILVTGALGEELAVETIKRGATDYILKDRLSRLAPAVQRAMNEADQRVKHHRAEQELRQSEERFRQLTDSIREVFWMTDLHKNQMIYISPGYEAIWGRTCESLYASARTWLEAIHSEDRARVLDAALTKQTKGHYDEEYRIIRPDGAIRWIHDRAFPIRDESGKIYRIAGIAEDITSHKQAEQAVRESEARKSAIMESVLDAILAIDAAGRITEFNSAAEKIFGHHRADVMGKEMAEVIIPLSLRDRHRRGFARYLATGEDSILGKRIDIQAMRSDGAEFPAELTITRVKLGGPPAFTAYIRDISERKSAERRLEARNAVIRTLVESATLEEAARGVLLSIGECLGWEMGAFWEIGKAANVLRCVEVWCSPATRIPEFLEITRSTTFSHGQGLPGRVWHLARPTWIPDVLADPNFPRGPIAAKCGLHGAFGFPILLRNEVIGVVEFFSHEIREPDSALLGMMIALGNLVGQFIARKQAEEARQKAEANYRGIYENAIEGIFQTTPEGKYLSANPALARMLGYDSPEDLIASVSDINQQICVDPESRTELKRRLEAEGNVRGFENQAYRKDGSKIWISINARIVRDARGEVLYYEGTSQDITERKRAVEKAHLLADAMQSTKDFISITDCENRFTFVNQAFLEAYGYTESEVLGRRPDFLYSLKNPPGLCGEVLQRTLFGGWQGELLNCRKDGSEFPISLDTSQIKDAQGRTLGLVGVARDISDRKRAEKRAAAFSLLGYRLSAAVSPRQAAEIIMEGAADLLGWDAGCVHLRSTAEDKLVPLLAIDTIAGQRMPVQAKDLAIEPGSLLGLVMKEGALINTQDGIGETAIPLASERHRASASSMYVPIHAEGAAIGILSVQSYASKAYSQNDLALLQSLGEHCGEALQRIKITDALREAEASFRSIFENATEGIFRTTPEGRYLNANPTLARMLGYESPQALISSISDIENQSYVNPSKSVELKDLMETSGHVQGFEVERFRKDGIRFWTSINGYAVRDASGMVLYYEGTTQDVTQRKRAESVTAALTVLGHRLSAAFTPTEAAVIILDVASKLIGWEAGSVYSCSQTGDEFLPLLILESKGEHPLSSGILETHFLPTLRLVREEGGRLFNASEAAAPGFCKFEAANGLPVSVMCVPIRLGKTTLGVVSLQSREAQVYSLKDLELLQALADHCGAALERIRIADSLRLMEGNYQSIFENATEGIFQATPEGRFVIANPAMARMFGYDSPEEMKSTFVPHEQTFVRPERLHELKRLVTEHGSIKGFEAERFRKDRSTFWMSMNVHAVRDDNGAFLFFEGTEQDITERKRAESVLQESERKLRLIAENTADGIFAFDMERRPLYANSAVEDLTGYTFEEIQERGFINWLHPDDQQRMLKYWEGLYSGKGYSEVDFRMITKTGQVKWCSSTWGPLFDEHGCQIGVQGRERDITERKELEREDRKSVV